MAKVIYKKYQLNNDKIASAHNKWFGRIVHLETVDLDGICKHMIKHGTIFTDDVVSGVVKKFVGCIQELLLESKKVKIDGIGTFYLACQSVGADEADEFDVRKNITNLRVRFSGDRAKGSGYKKAALMEAAHLTDIEALGFTVAATDSTNGSTSGSGSDPDNNGGNTNPGAINDEP